MNAFANYFVVLLSLVLVVQACGPTQQEIEEHELAVRDSIATIRQNRAAEAERAAKEKAELEAEEKRKEEEEAEMEAEVEEVKFSPITFNKNGKFSLQVEAWRSEHSAEHGVRRWKDRGFEDAFVVQYGDESTGDIWFRIRLGRFGSYEMAQRQKNSLEADFNILAWIDFVE